MENLYHPRRGQVQLASGLNLLAAIWLVLSAFTINTDYAENAAATNNVVFGVIVAILAVLRVLGAYGDSWMSWLNAVIGAWIVVVPWAVTANTGVGPTREVIVNNVITGAVILAFGVWSALATNTEPSTATYRQQVGPPAGR